MVVAAGLTGVLEAIDGQASKSGGTPTDAVAFLK